MQNLHRISLVSTSDREVPEETTARGSHPSISHCDHPSILWHCGATTYANFIFKRVYQLIGLIWKTRYFNVNLQSPMEHFRGCCTCYAKHVIIDRTMANWRVTSMSSSILSLNMNWITVLEAKTPVPKQLQVDHFGCPNKKWRDWVGSNFTQHAVGLGNVVVAHLSIQSCEEGWPKLNFNIIQP